VFAVAGAGAFFSATVRAPLTGIVLAAELTGEFQLILPVAITCITATLVAHALGGRPIYTMMLERTLAAEPPSA
jgi:CIC family chloride channel protein